MLIRIILKFIRELKGRNDLIPCDILLCESLEKNFSHRDPQQLLNTDDIQFLLNCFECRSEQIASGFENDYMLNTGVANQRWTQLAKDLALLTSYSYVQILLPAITNTVDFNNLSLLTETERPENFYLGHDNKTLYRKRGLCEHLIKNQFFLSTCRDLSTNKLSAMSVEELTRLQSCKQVNGAFSIGDELFSNFWNFLQKKVFTQLRSRGELQIDLLPHLLALIEQYYVLKANNADFRLFKESAQCFFLELYKCQLEEINFFYGIEIPFRGKKYYLLDFLIVINKVETYVLDEHLSALAEWLFKFHPSLKIKHEELEPIYSNVQKEHSNGRHPIVRPTGLKERSLNQCMKMLLSLFTLEFDYLPLTGRTISFWDIANPVFSEGGTIFALFEPLLITNKIDELLPLYLAVIEEYIIPGRADKSCYTWLTRFNSVNNWYRHVDDNTLFQTGVYWCQAELLMPVLLKVRTHRPGITSQINKFLDELIHTYAQDNYDLLKQFRVNVLFSKFTKKLPEPERKYLNILMQLHERQNTQTDFLNDCIGYIVDRLSEISTVTTGGAIQFFSGIRKMDRSKLVFPYMGYDSLNEIIDAIKGRLYSPELNLDDELLEKMTIYLRTLTRPILTIEELQEARNSVRTEDYLGAPT